MVQQREGPAIPKKRSQLRGREEGSEVLTGTLVAECGVDGNGGSDTFSLECDECRTSGG